MKKKFLGIIAVLLVLIIAFFFLGGLTFQSAPYALPISPMTAYRITSSEGDKRFFGNDPNTIQGYAIVQRQVIANPRLQQDVVDLIDSRLIYRMGGAMCFEPGIAIRVGNGPDAVDVLICLTCEHVYFFRGNEVAYRDLNSIGIARIKKMYGRLFSGHDADGVDADMRRATDERSAERDRRMEQMAEAATMPTTVPATMPAR
jgi:hypothetical protein